MLETLEQIREEAKKYVEKWYGSSRPITLLFQCDIIKLPDGKETILEDTFSQRLFKLIKERGMKETDCYKRANIDRRLFSKIRSNDNYRPTKKTIFALCLALRLSSREADKLFSSAGYSLSYSIKTDIVMDYILKKEIYNIVMVNEILDSLGCTTLTTL